MPAGDSYLYATLRCIIRDLVWLEKLIDEKGPEEQVEFKFTSLKKEKSILRSRSCHLILLIRDKTNRQSAVSDAQVCKNRRKEF